MSKVLHKYAKELYCSGALRISKQSFELRSGGVSHIYCDHRKFILDKHNLQILMEVYSELLKHFHDYDSLCSMDSVCSPIITGALALKHKCNLVITKNTQLTHGTEQQLWIGEASRIVCVDDIITSGALLLDTIELLHINKVNIQGAVSPIIRDVSFLSKYPQLDISTLGSLEDLMREVEKYLTIEEIDIVKKEGYIN